MNATIEESKVEQQEFSLDEKFKKELTSLLNRNGIDNDLNEPDFILSEYLCAHLYGLYRLKIASAEWHDKK